MSFGNNFKIWVYLSDPSQADRKTLEETVPVFPLYRLPEFSSLYDGPEYFVSLPLVTRNQDEKEIIEALGNLSGDTAVQGIFVHNTECLELAREAGFSKKIITGPGLYVFNRAAISAFPVKTDGFVYPYELNSHELKEIESDKGILTVYGRTPLMVSANCVRNIGYKCMKDNGNNFGYLRDRKNAILPVLFQCKNCYNVIYNALPISLHEYIGKKTDFTNDLLLYFTNEERRDVTGVINYYRALKREESTDFPIKDFTKAYFNHGVE